MKRIDRKTARLQPYFQIAAYLLVLLIAPMLIVACSNSPGDGDDDLAVAKLTVEQQQATSYLPLNADKPGTPVDALRYLVPGKYTYIEYFSSADGPCMALAPKLQQITQMRRDVAVRTVDINRPGVQGVDWQSPIAQELELQTVPYFIIYDPRQSLRAKGRPAMEQVNQFVQGVPN